jgi:ABC-type dipeptide/oligopeptide/nickel transport system permease component
VTQQYLEYMGNILIPRINESGQRRSATEDYLINIELPGGEQSLRWLNFGPSFANRSRTVNDLFRENFPVSAELGTLSLIVALSIGTPLGIIAALGRNTYSDYIGMGIAILGVSVPVIILGPFMQYFFGLSLGWLPMSGWGSVDKMIMPVFALGFAQAALIARLTRASLLQVLHEDYVRTARAKGLHERTVIVIHALKNALIPVVTVLGPLVAFLVTGSFVTEQIFAIPGIGAAFVTSIGNRDYPVVMGTVLLFATILVIANTAVDIVYAWIDPRIRFS